MGKKEKESRKVRPGVSQIEAEIRRVDYRVRFRRLLRSTIYTLIVVAAIAVIIAVIFLPVLRMYGNSMEPTMTEGDIIVSVKNAEMKTGDIVALYFGSKVLVKRCIATEYQWVDIDTAGNVYIDGKMLEEPYLTEKAFGETNIELPYQVPDNMIFVIGDSRETSIDSRNSVIGCIDTENIIGKVIFRVWPMNKFGFLGK